MAGFYESTKDPRISVRTYCECSYPNCIMKWAVYKDDESMESEYYCTRVEATASANEMIGAI
jgi:hypothetical protein